MRLILLGAPGAGKGTQSKFLCEEFSIPQISTGDMLRSAIANGSDVGMEAKRIIDAGQLVSDQIIVDLIKQRLAEKDTQNGALFDGFPRTLTQADALKAMKIAIDAVVEITVEHDEIVRRISGRRIHEASGRSYHVRYNPPKVEGFDDETGEPLIQRKDDVEDTVRKRLRIYEEQTAPLVAYYSDWEASGDPNAPRYLKIEGIGKVEDISQNILKSLIACNVASGCSASII